MKESKKELLDEKINKLMKKALDLLRVNAISVSALQIKNTEDLILNKLDNEKNSIEYGINSINKNVFKNQKKYSNVFEEEEKLLDEYKKLLEDSARFYDNAIFVEIIKILKEELSQLELNKKLMLLKSEESKAKEKLDNSDDAIAEEIYGVEDEISKSETKVKRTKTLLKNKIREKENGIVSAIETKDKDLQRDIKGPKVIKSATRFFMGKFNPYKMIEKNVFFGFRDRIEGYKVEAEEIFNKKIRYTENNVLDTINDMVQKTEKKLLKIT